MFQFINQRGLGSIANSTDQLSFSALNELTVTYTESINIERVLNKIVEELNNLENKVYPANEKFLQIVEMSKLLPGKSEEVLEVSYRIRSLKDKLNLINQLENLELKIDVTAKEIKDIEQLIEEVIESPLKVDLRTRIRKINSTASQKLSIDESQDSDENSQLEETLYNILGDKFANIGKHARNYVVGAMAEKKDVDYSNTDDILFITNKIIKELDYKVESIKMITSLEVLRDLILELDITFFQELTKERQDKVLYELIRKDCLYKSLTEIHDSIADIIDKIDDKVSFSTSLNINSIKFSD